MNPIYKNKKFQYIYMIKNSLNNKCYIGFHSTNEIYDNYYGSGVYLRRAIKKYGEQNFIKGILEFCSLDDWESRETYWINEMNTKQPHGYNLTNGGEGTLGIIISEKSKLQMSKTRRERKIAEGENNGMFGKHHKKESIEKISNTRKEKGVAKKENNPKFDKTIYKFYNTKTQEIFEGYKYDLARKINSTGSAINAVIKGWRTHHKNWIII
jgi:group I intron endonuclease